MAIDMVLKFLAQGADKAKSEIVDLKDTVVDTANATERATEKTDKLNEEIKETGTAAATLGDKLEKVRNYAAGLAVLGAGGLALANSFTEAAIEADTLGAKLQGMMAGVNLSGKVSEIQDLGEAIANVMGGDDDEIAAAIGEAVASGRVMRLRQYGIVVDKLGQQAITAAQGISAQAGAQEALNQVTKAANTSLATMKDEIGGAAIAAHAFENRWGNVQETMGEGTGIIKAALYQNVLSPLLDIAEAHPGLVTTAGGVLSIGSAAATAVGGFVSLGSQVGMTALAFPGLAAKAAATFATITTGAGVAASATLRLAMTTLAAVAPYLAVAAAAAAVFYGIDKLAHWKEDKKLQENIERGDDTDQQRLELANKQRAKRGLSPLTMEQYEGDPNNEDPNVDPISAMNGINRAIDKANQAAASTPTVPVMPAMPAAADNNESFGSLMSKANSASNSGLSIDTGAANPLSVNGTPVGATASAANKITLKPKTRLSQNSGGDYVVEILPEKFVIPNNFGRAVEAL